MTTTNQVLDAAGYPTSGPADGVARYDHAVDLLLRYHPDVLGAAEGLATQDAAMPMAQAFLAYLSLMSTDQPDLDGAREAARTLDSLGGNEREAAHAAAIRRVARWQLARGGRRARPAPRPVADRHPRPRDGAPARLLHRRRAQPPRPCGAIAPELRSRRSARCVRSWDAGVRARGERRLRACRGGRARGARPSPRRRVGAARGGPHLRDAWPGRHRDRVPARRESRIGGPATSSPCTTGGTSVCT